MILLLEYPIEEELMWCLLWIAITNFGVFVITQFDLINGIPAKVSEPSFDTAKAANCNGGVSSQFKGTIIFPIIGKHNCPLA